MKEMPHRGVYEAFQFSKKEKQDANSLLLSIHLTKTAQYLSLLVEKTSRAFVPLKC